MLFKYSFLRTSKVIGFWTTFDLILNLFKYVSISILNYQTTIFPFELGDCSIFRETEK